MSYPNISIIRAGIWYKATALVIENPEAEKWLLRVREAEGGDGAVDAVTIAEILEQSGADCIDILKLDIEGAEREVFSHNSNWLEKVNLLIIELHDHYKPGCSESVYSAISRYDFKKFQRGENVFLVNNRLHKAAL
jgi:hypothetical protein